MTPGAGDLVRTILGTAAALIVSSAVLLGLLAGFCVLLGFLKLRSSGGGARVVRNLDEALGQRPAYLTPDAPRGRTDQLQTPELLGTGTRNSA
jgi:hypothetical protein